MPSRVLIVDDDPMLCKLLGAHLATAGYDVIETASGAQGLTLLRNQGPRIALVDYDMPVMNGIEFCRQVRADPQIPFTHLVIMTAHVERSLTIAALDSGANDFMTKPFHRGELLARLRAGEQTVRLHDQAAQAGQLESERNRLLDTIAGMQQSLALLGQELRTPMASLEAMTQCLLDPASRSTGQWEKSLAQMSLEIQRLSAHVDELSATPPTPAALPLKASGRAA